MKIDLMEILCCPICKGDVALIVENEVNDDITKGRLYCINCKINYPIEDGIPNMLPPNYR